jgi:hypothetical protein
MCSSLFGGLCTPLSGGGGRGYAHGIPGRLRQRSRRCRIESVRMVVGVLMGNDLAAASRVDVAIAVALTAVTTVWFLAYALVFVWVALT